MKQLLVFLFLLCAASVSAQDVIVKKDGSTIVCRVVELTDTEITYKKWSDLNGSNYVMERSAASAINYETGKKVDLSEATNLYTPNNQNDGTQQYNDNALLALYAASYRYNPAKQAKNQRIIGWVGGSILFSGGLAFLYFSFDNPYATSVRRLAGVGLIGAGATWTWGFLSLAKRNAIEANRLQSSSIYNLDIPCSESSTFSIGADLLRDNTLGQNTIGLGLRYNF